MPRIIPLVEGQGDVDAIPTLLYKLLHDRQEWQWHVGRPYRVRSLGALKKNLTYFVLKASKEKECAAILIVLDSDDDCPVGIAEALAAEIRKLNLAQPVAIVFAHREYEAWFLASLPTIAGHHGLPADVVYEGEVEDRRDAKGWLRQQMPVDKYAPTTHQKKFTSLIDIELAYEHSRSFRRLYHAIEQLLEAAQKGERGYVSPLPAEKK
ncbi:MAG: DUF4276 family protein [Ardenticatenaceae bacterium]